MAERMSRKSVFRAMFRAENERLNIAGILCKEIVQGKNGVAARSYAGPEHRLNMFSHFVQLSTLIPEHNTSPLEREVFVQEGRQGNSPIFGDPGEGLFRAARPLVNKLSCRAASKLQRTASLGRPGEVSVANSPHNAPGRLTVRLASHRSLGEIPCP